MKKIYVIHSTAFDFQKELYGPLMKIQDFEFVFPHLKENAMLDSGKLIRNASLVLAEVSYPSTGSGIELGRAEAGGVPIIAIFKNGSKISSSIKFLTKDIVEYEKLDDSLEIIKELIKDRMK